jgi:hypothetical protein
MVECFDRAGVGAVSIPRVTLEVARELSAQSWETLLAPALKAAPSARIVRTTPMRSRALELPLTLPLRILEIDAEPWRLLEPVVRGVFGNHPAESG